MVLPTRGSDKHNGISFLQESLPSAGNPPDRGLGSQSTPVPGFSELVSLGWTKE